MSHGCTLCQWHKSPSFSFCLGGTLFRGWSMAKPLLIQRYKWTKLTHACPLLFVNLVILMRSGYWKPNIAFPATWFSTNRLSIIVFGWPNTRESHADINYLTAAAHLTSIITCTWFISTTGRFHIILILKNAIIFTTGLWGYSALM